MLMLGAGETGKTVFINAILETYTHHVLKQNLGLMASSGVASTLFGGSTTHSWAGISTNSSSEKPSHVVATKRQAHMAANCLLIIDEISMFEKSLLTKLSDSVMVTCSQLGL